MKWTLRAAARHWSPTIQGRDLPSTAELALDAEGKFLAFRTSNLSNVGAYTASFVPLTKGTQLMTSLYRMPAARRGRAP